MSKNKLDPFYVQWHITKKCNLRCKHCYQENYSGQELSLNEMKKFFQDFLLFCKKFGKEPTMSITGGEPLVRDCFFELLDFIKETKPGIKFNLLCNGTLLTKENIKRLEGLVDNIQLSLEGSTKEINDSVRGKGAFEKIMVASKLVSNSKIGLHYHSVLTKNNFEDSEKIIDLAEKNKANALVFSRLVPQGSGETISKQMLSKQELKTVFEKIIDKSIKLKERKPKLFVNRYRTLWAICDEGLGGACSAGLASFDVMHNGDIFPCRRLPIKAGNIKEDSLESIWTTSKVFKQLRNRSKFKNCGNCKHLDRCGGCRAIVYATKNNLFDVDPQCFFDKIGGDMACHLDQKSIATIAVTAK